MINRKKSFLLTIGVNLDIIIAAIKVKTLSGVLNAENLEEGTKTELRNIANNAQEINRHMNMIISNADVLTAEKCLMFLKRSVQESVVQIVKRLKEKNIIAKCI